MKMKPRSFLSTLSQGVLLFLILTTSAISQESQTVIADGIGSDLDSAIQNSAENALIQLVGSFIDAETSIEKRVEIRGAVKEQSKSISSRTSEYSQGMIEGIEVLSSEQDVALTRVTSKVTVRLEQFQAYIKRTALAEGEVKQGVFAKVQSQKEQSENLGDIVVGRLMTEILNLEVVKLEVGSIDVISDPQHEAAARKKLEPATNETLISISVAARIDPDFLANAYDTLEKTAQAGFKGSRVTRYTETAASKESMKFWVLFADFTDPRTSNSVTVCNFSGGEHFICMLNTAILDPEQARLYVFPESKVNDLCAAADAAMPKDFNRNLSAAASLRVLDADQNTVTETFLTGDDNFQSNTAFIVGDMGELDDSRWEYFPLSALTFLHYANLNGNCAFGVNTASNFDVIMKLTDEELSRAQSIEIGLEH